MFQQLFKNYNHTLLSGIGMLLFMSVFVGVLVWVTRKSSTEAFKEIEKLPLQK